MVNNGISFLVVIGFIILIAVIVVGSVLSTLARGLGMLLGVYPNRQPRQSRAANVQPFPPQPVPISNVPAGYTQCRVPGCRHINPASAKFCRHCGHAFPQGSLNSSRQPMSRQLIYFLLFGVLSMLFWAFA